MGQYKKLWYTLIVVLIGAFSILGYYGFEVYREAPPVPEKYVTTDGQTVITKEQILHGQTAWQTTGGMQLGSVWGHGAYQAPDWTADWLHRELVNWLDLTANKEFGKNFEQLDEDQKALLQGRLTREYRGTSIDEQGTVVLSPVRLQAIEKTAQHYIDLYGDEPSIRSTRENFAMKEAPWMDRLKWPIYCFVAVAFWNMVGAGVFGFLINPPISLYYIQGLNTTAVHAHAALFGVYGFLALGFVFLVARYLRPNTPFNENLMKFGFWWLNAGLVLMILTSLLPIGVIQGFASMSKGLWYARSEEFMQQPLFETLRWVRMIGDVMFVFGALAFFWQMFTMIFIKPKAEK